MLHEIDDEFLNDERRGEGTTTYPLHGEIVAVDESAGRIQILRPRTAHSSDDDQSVLHREHLQHISPINDRKRPRAEVKSVVAARQLP
ncbi:MAG: hypothetical protein Q8N13_14430 [Acidovorax sp.]|nr:hypothetical protein [Acidovorax sp.]